MSKLKLYATAAEIENATIAFSKAGVRLQSEAHKLACSVLAHVGEHGDIRVVSRFLDGFPEMSRVNAVRSWFEAFGPISFEGNDPKFVRGAKTRLGEALETPFWQFKPEAEYKPLNAAAELERLAKRLRTDAKKTGADHSHVIQALGMIKIDLATPIPVPLTIEHQPAVH
jgi:hypothetical protein